jgi:hypothetical protein
VSLVLLHAKPQQSRQSVLASTSKVADGSEGNSLSHRAGGSELYKRGRSVHTANVLQRATRGKGKVDFVLPLYILKL